MIKDVAAPRCDGVVRAVEDTADGVSAALLRMVQGVRSGRPRTNKRPACEPVAVPKTVAELVTRLDPMVAAPWRGPR
ncbi:hypothetical protein [Nocardia arthritidis]|uniref:Uncharacterized protein n=1 Tax=Nocardia arthritidis TaxID=228602 RepID=A0A6G9Y9L6_9NOCA|nr:hypothetical protein [Nocardia arthritidis]QIS09955.1 hypothetical protein F5544_10285 [Nocardia arthritidis]